MQSPKISKCILNTGIGKRAVVDRKQIMPVLLGLETISGQRPMITRAKKSVDKFKLRENMPIGCKVTLRKKKLNFFLDRLVNLVLPKPGLEEWSGTK
jgi:large subunit ribosomal protein L5